MSPKRVAIYARVSTDDKGQDPRNQSDELRTWAKREGLEIVSEYVDQETGTGKRRRLDFERMIEDAERGAFDTLAVWALDRLSREGALKTLLLVERLRSCGVRVKSLREPWLDPASPTYELLLPIFAWIAKQESERLGQRVRAGLARVRAEGKKKLGRPRVISDVDAVRRLRAEGYSLRTIAARLGVSPGTVHKTLAPEDTERQGVAGRP